MRLSASTPAPWTRAVTGPNLTRTWCSRSATALPSVMSTGKYATFAPACLHTLERCSRTSRWAITFLYSSPTARGLPSPPSASAMAFFISGFDRQSREVVRLGRRRGRAAGQHQRRAVRLGQGDGHLRGHPAGAAGDQDHVARAEVDELRTLPPRGAGQFDRAAVLGRNADLRRAGRQHLLDQRRRGRAGVGERGGEVERRQLTSGHSCRAVLARPARPPACRVGSRAKGPRSRTRRRDGRR